jgi:hypothetical protein
MTTASDSCPPPAIFFSGCSWGCIYHVGVYEGLLRRFGGVDGLQNVIWGGASSGALTALMAALKYDPSHARGIYDALADMARVYGVFNKMSIYHAIVLEKLLPDGGLEHSALRGRLHIGVTRPPWTNELICEWSSNRELRNILHCSFHIPFYMNHTEPLPDGRWAIDGGFTGNIATIRMLPTCTVCVFSREATIRPHTPYGMLADCFAPPEAKMRDAAVAEGLRDAIGADMSSSRLALPHTLPAGLHASCVASLLPGPAMGRVVLGLPLAYLTCAAGWAGRIAEQGGALGFVAGAAAISTAAIVRSRL